ncbi:MAG: hypothetical protein KDI50_09755 [Candidatus Competibacteraceae bacterium]|nr:hypothetical protein [Candidatus Competibacteraceae bacterium]
MQPFSSAEERQERQELIRLLRETPPELIRAMGEQQTLEAVKWIAGSVPFYGRLLAEQGIQPEEIDSIAAFRSRLPILDKHNTFARHTIQELSAGGHLDNIRTVLTSSGHSGVFSFGVNTRENLLRSARSIDTGLQYLFGVDDHPTLLINCLPMGVKVNTNATFLAETSVRDDMVFALVNKFGPEFEEIIIIGEGSFIKKIIEDGQEQHGIDWPQLRVHIITGEEGIAENYRTYLGGLLGVTDFDAPNGKIIGSSMGVAELDLNLFHETRETIRIRRLAHRDADLRKALFGEDHGFCPMFFVYYPHRCYVETLDGEIGELVISMLSPEMKIPLLRYRAGDIGKVFEYREVVATLAAQGVDLQPDLKLPFVGVYGRGKMLPTSDGPIYPEAVKEALYAHADIAATITGNFRLRMEQGSAVLDIQLREGRRSAPRAVERFLAALADYSRVMPQQVAFGDYLSFPYNMSVDWERKFAYL